MMAHISQPNWLKFHSLHVKFDGKLKYKLWLLICHCCLFCFLFAAEAISKEIDHAEVNQREVVPLINAQLNDQGMRKFAVRALERFTSPTPIWNESSWKSINQMKHDGGAWDQAELNSSAIAYGSCLSLQESLLLQGESHRIVSDFVTPDKVALYDNNGNPILYDVLLNHTAVQSIIDYKFKQEKTFSFPGQIQDTSPQVPGAIFIKFAWKVLSEDEILSDKFASGFYREQVLAHLPTRDKCERITVVLMGMHITLKPMSNGEGKQFTWATFIHSKAVPNYQEINDLDASNNVWLMFNSGQPVMQPVQVCPEVIEYQQACCDSVSRFTPTQCETLTKVIIESPDCIINKKPASQGDSAQLVQLCPATSQASSPALEPWGNYRLIDNQWMNSTTNIVKPVFLSNPMLEPYFDNYEYFHGDKIMGNSSCFNCHSKAKETDMIFSISSLLGVKVNK
ncbi:hypothetical protein [Photobacterium rosenbergii]|uniref:Uncharacterized protein n=1 Tax=Photobacterium rosenbergii TaxID=294936 RepID=A0ABU3ZCG5_9GAMM|nr:hypothetical protein [Photobacterium rosenbergii]MDV5167810.1 hypothetical protein [Photobacterium rosenbergii]